MSFHLDHEEFYEAFSDGEVDRLWDAYQYAVKGGESAPKIYASQEKLREPLAAYAHDAWAGWMEYMFSKFEPHVPTTYSGQGRWVHLKLPTAFYERWRRQMETAYADLPESEKESDREQADKILETIRMEENSAVIQAFEKLTELEKRRVHGEVTLTFTAEYPANLDLADEDPAVAALLSAVGVDADIYVFGEDHPPVRVSVEVFEDDVVIEEDEVINE